MRILNIMLGSGLGGLEKVAHDYARMLAGLGFESVSFLQDGAKSQYLYQQMPALDIKTTPAIGQFDPRPHYNLKKIVKAFHPDIMIAHGGRAMKLIKKMDGYTGIKIAVMHNQWAQDVKGFDGLITVNNAIKRKYIDELKQNSHQSHLPRIFHLPNAIGAIPTKQKGYTAKQSKIFQVGAMGRFHKVKGFDCLIKAMALLRDHQDINCIIAGAGDEEDSLNKLIDAYGLSSSVKLWPWQEEKEAFFSNLDVFCVPSRQESFGLTILEAWSYQVPVIASACDGPKELIKNEETGLFFPIEDETALSHSLLRLKNDQDLRQKIAMGGYEDSYTYHYVEIAKELSTILKALLNKE